MRKLLVAITIFLFCLSVSGSAESPTYGLGREKNLVNFIENYDYRYTSFGQKLSPNPFAMVWAHDNTLIVSACDADLVVDIESLNIFEAKFPFLTTVDGKQQKQDVFSIYAFIAALEFDPSDDVLFKLVNSSVLLESDKLLNKMLDNFDIERTMSGETVTVYESNQYTYSFQFDSTDSLDKQYEYFFLTATARE